MEIGNGILLSQTLTLTIRPLSPVPFRGVAKMEAFSQRLGLAAERLEVLGILLKHKEVRI